MTSVAFVDVIIVSDFVEVFVVQLVLLRMFANETLLDREGWRSRGKGVMNSVSPDFLKIMLQYRSN